LKKGLVDIDEFLANRSLDQDCVLPLAPESMLLRSRLENPFSTASAKSRHSMAIRSTHQPHGNAECLGGLEVEEQLNFRSLLDRRGLTPAR
jgi:hypothetical protein